MAYPPTIPPNSRADGTVTFTNHPSDHNATADALTDIVNELGADPKGGFADVAARISAMVPPGVISAYGGGSAPSGYLLCDNSAVDRTTYAALFAAIGTSFGVGDGSTTFNLPDLKGRVPVGRDALVVMFNTLGEDGGSRDAVPVNHAHTVDGHEHGLGSHTHTIAHAHTSTNSGLGVTPKAVVAGSDFAQQSGTPSDQTFYDLDVASTGPSTNANSGGPSIPNTTGGTSPGTDNGDVTEAGTDKNVQPYQVINYIIKT